ncbi:MAG: glycosyltransferase family 2 protein [Chloroflexi bacterium HGW-Chloroflexi-1]|nr:MAG: glycosyltransferase family 2 protein [Chloroflexi bacterium HGW-Chloroflexi-1]
MRQPTSSPAKPTASVIIPNYNGLRFLPTCLDALRGQIYPADLTEVILVDDASTDDSVVFVREHYPEVVVVQLARNSGLAVGCNAGAAAARGDLLVLLNNDTEAEPGWLAALVETVRAHPQAGAIASKMLLFDRRDHLHNAGDVMGADGIPRNRGVWQRDQGQFDADRTIFGGCGGGVAYRREAWEQAGGFDERLFMYLEDVDLAWRLQLLGWDAVFAPDARLYHHVSATGGGALASFYTGRNTIWVIAKDMPGPLIRRHFGRIVAAQWRVTRDALAAWRGEAARARVRGQLAGIVGLPKVLRWRRAVQEKRVMGIEELERLLVREQTG